MSRRRNDILWKTILEEVFDDLLRFLDRYADKKYDMGRGFVFLDKELAKIYPEPDEESDTRFADKLVKVYTLDGKEDWILIHVEIQGDTSSKKEFAERMFRYFYRIFDKYRKPVSAIAIFTGWKGGEMPDRYVYDCGGTSLIYKYEILRVIDYDDEEVEYIKNPFAIVLMAARTALLEGQVDDEFLMKWKLMVAKQLLRKNMQVEKVRAIFAFLNNYVRFEDPKWNSNFIEQINRYDNKNYNMGIIEYLQQEAKQEGREEGRVEGREEGREEGLKVGRLEEREKLTQMLLQDPNFTVARIAKMLKVSIYYVNKIKKQARA